MTAMEEENTSEKEETKVVNIGLEDVLKGAGNLIDIVTKLKEEGKSGRLSLEGIKNLNEQTKGLFGVSVKIGTGGISTTEEVIGKLTTEEKSPVNNKGVREPVTDVFEEKDCIEVIAELPGLEEKDIRYEIKGDTLTIYTVSDKRKYKKELPLPFSVSVKDIQSVYKNGILKFRLKKRI